MTSNTPRQGTFDDATTIGSAPASLTPSRSDPVSGLFIAAIVAGFLIFWPIGLVLLAWALWSQQIKNWPFVRKFLDRDLKDLPMSFTSMMARKPDNVALKEYLDREQARLHAEQKNLDELVRAFEAFKAAERQQSDQRDFEAFLRQREAGSGHSA